MKRGSVVTLRGDPDFVGIVRSVKKDKCGQIPVYWILWHGQALHKRVWIEPYKLERLVLTPLKCRQRAAKPATQ